MATRLYVGNLSFDTTEGDLHVISRRQEESSAVASLLTILNKSRGSGLWNVIAG
jgi:hypothetical protein